MVFLVVVSCILGYLAIGAGVGVVLVYLYNRHKGLCRDDYRYNDDRKGCWCKIEFDDEEILWPMAKVFAYGAFILWPLSLVGWLVIVPVAYYVIRPLCKYVLKPVFNFLVVKPGVAIFKLYDRMESRGEERGKKAKEAARMAAIEAENQRIKFMQEKAAEEADKKKHEKIDAALDRAGKLVDRIDRREGYDGHED
jgi:hypothetical protein